MQEGGREGGKGGLPRLGGQWGGGEYRLLCFSLYALAIGASFLTSLSFVYRASLFTGLDPKIDWNIGSL